MLHRQPMSAWQVPFWHATGASLSVQIWHSKLLRNALHAPWEPLQGFHEARLGCVGWVGDINELREVC